MNNGKIDMASSHRASIHNTVYNMYNFDGFVKELLYVVFREEGEEVGVEAEMEKKDSESVVEEECIVGDGGEFEYIKKNDKKEHGMSELVVILGHVHWPHKKPLDYRT